MMILKTFLYPRKAQKPRNKSIGYSGLTTYPSGDAASHCMQLNLFVFFRVFRGQLGFLE